MTCGSRQRRDQSDRPNNATVAPEMKMSKKKIKTITLAHPIPNPNDRENKNPLYRVNRLTDSTEFSPRQLLTKKQVDELCVADDWKVYIVALGD
jgi:hypothetical protein